MSASSGICQSTSWVQKRTREPLCEMFQVRKAQRSIVVPVFSLEPRLKRRVPLPDDSFVD